MQQNQSEWCAELETVDLTSVDGSSFCTTRANEPGPARFATFVFGCCWVANFAALLASLIWICSDGRFGDAALWLRSILTSKPSEELWGILQLPELGARFLWIFVLAVAGCASLAGAFASLFFGPPRFRRLRSWLGFTTLVALWLMLISSWPEIAWQAQGWRLARITNKLEQLIQEQPINRGPDVGETQFGYANTYQGASGTTVMLLARFDVPNSHISFRRVELSTGDTHRFELSGSEQGAWLEWRPRGGEPQPFVSPVFQQHHVDRFKSLGSDWFLVRYKGA